MTILIFEKIPENGNSYPKTKTLEELTHVELLPQFLRDQSAVQFYNRAESAASKFSQAVSIPQLEIPEISIIDFIALLKEFQRTTTSSDVRTAIVNANKISLELDQNRAAELANKTLMNAQQAKKDDDEKAKKIANWVLGVASFLMSIVAIALTIATGGAALILVIGVVGAVMAALNVADLVVHEIGCKRKNEYGEEVPLSISIPELAIVCQEADTRNGGTLVIGLNSQAGTPGALTKEEYEKRKEAISLGVSVGVGVVMLLFAFVGIASAIRGGVGLLQTGTKTVEAAADAGEALASTTAQVSQAASRGQTVAMLVSSAGSMITAGGAGYNAYLSFILAFQNSDLRTSQINEKDIQSVIEALQQQFEKNQQNFRSAMDFQQTLRTRIADAMEAFHASSVSIARNCHF